MALLTRIGRWLGLDSDRESEGDAEMELDDFADALPDMDCSDDAAAPAAKGGGALISGAAASAERRTNAADGSAGSTTAATDGAAGSASSAAGAAARAAPRARAAPTGASPPLVDISPQMLRPKPQATPLWVTAEDVVSSAAYRVEKEEEEAPIKEKEKAAMALPQLKLRAPAVQRGMSTEDKSGAQMVEIRAEDLKPVKGSAEWNRVWDRSMLEELRRGSRSAKNYFKTVPALGQAAPPADHRRDSAASAARDKAVAAANAAASAPPLGAIRRSISNSALNLVFGASCASSGVPEDPARRPQLNA